MIRSRAFKISLLVGAGVVLLGLLAGAFLLGFWLRTTPATNYFPDVIVPKANTPSELVAEAYALLEANQYEFDSYDTDQLSEGAANGLVQGLDERFTTYLSSAARQSFSESLEGEYVGIGISFVTAQDRTFEVGEVFANSPAHGVGLMTGDKIVEVDGDNVVGLSEEEFVAKVRGERGDVVQIGIIRETEDMGVVELSFDIVRDRVEIQAVTSARSSDGRYGVVKLRQFSRNVQDEFLPAVCELAGSEICSPNLCPADGCGTVEGLVIDLRGNTGGFVRDVLEVASIFLGEQHDPQIIAYEITTGGSRDNWSIRYDSVKLTEVPLVVLVNGTSASGSEVMAGALRDHGRAVLIGETTLGKGSVNQLFELSNGGGINITIARWFTPCGSLIENIGVTPAIETELTGEEGLALAYQTLADGTRAQKPATCDS